MYVRNTQLTKLSISSLDFIPFGSKERSSSSNLTQFLKGILQSSVSDCSLHPLVVVVVGTGDACGSVERIEVSIKCLLLI